MRAAAFVILVACGSSSTSKPDGSSSLDTPGASAWTTGTPVLHGAVQETAAVAVAGKIYLIGGFDSDEGIVARVQAYDTATNTWSDAPSLPKPVHHANATVVNGTIYVTGALQGTNFTAIGDVYKLDPATETTWTARASMPSGRQRGSAVTGEIGGKIYVAGGFALGAKVLVDVYDPVADSWTALADLPAQRDHACGAAFGNTLIFASGRNAQITARGPEVYAYDVTANTWTQRMPIATARGGTACGAIDGRLYVTGGEGNPNAQTGVFPNVDVYDVANNTWTALDPMPHPKHGVAGAVWDRALYLLGGANVMSFGAVDTVDIFRP